MNHFLFFICLKREKAQVQFGEGGACLEDKIGSTDDPETMLLVLPLVYGRHARGPDICIVAFDLT